MAFIITDESFNQLLKKDAHHVCQEGEASTCTLIDRNTPGSINSTYHA